MILNHNQIEERNRIGAIQITPFDSKQVQPASYDLRVGAAAYTTSSGGQIDIAKKGYFELKPGDFGIVLTHEQLKFDLAHTARIGLRSFYARKGIVATTGPQVDPGFEGRLKVGVTNLSPDVISFPHLDDLITLELHQLGEPATRGYDGPNQNFETFTSEEIRMITEGGNTGLGGTIDELRSLSKNVGELSRNMDRLAESQEQLTQGQSRLDAGQNQLTQGQNKLDVRLTTLMWAIGPVLAVILGVGLLRA